MKQKRENPLVGSSLLGDVMSMGLFFLFGH